MIAKQHTSLIKAQVQVLMMNFFFHFKDNKTEASNEIELDDIDDDEINSVAKVFFLKLFKT
jgi:hypothetical protein